MSAETREAYLLRAADWMRENLFAPIGVTVPPVRVSTGFTGSRSGNRAIGSCWNAKASADGLAQVFISPVLSDSARVLDVLAHELIHAAHPDAKHGKVFKRTALAIGLEGKMTATIAGEALAKRLNALSCPETGVLGPYPHAQLDPGQSGVKKQSTRLLKIECQACEFVARASNKALTEVGIPYCACGERMVMASAS